MVAKQGVLARLIVRGHQQPGVAVALNWMNSGLAKHRRSESTGRTLAKKLEYPAPLCYLGGMTHTVREKQKLLSRVRRMKGQVEAIERALETEAGCEQVMHLIAGVRGAMAGLMAEVVEDHVRTHLVDPDKHPGALNAEAAEQLLDVVRTYLK